MYIKFKLGKSVFLAKSDVCDSCDVCGSCDSCDS